MSTRRRAFAVIFALFLVALVAGALLAVTSLMAADVRRSTRGAVDAQLRELLHAGTVAALQRLREEPRPLEAPFDVPTPPLLSAGVNVAPAESPDGAAPVVVVRARFADREESQRVAFERAGDSWRVRSITR
jgi:hypothetical protein